ncbi:MAG: FeoA family protein [Phycisphaerales bacterium]
MSDPAPIPALSLYQLKVGECGTIVEKKLDEGDRAMLRALGLEANSTVRICRAGEPCIVAVMTGGTSGGRLGDGCCRIGLARNFAERIFVAPSPARDG